MDAPTEVQGLAHEPAFRRLLVASVALHCGMVGFALFSPRFSAPIRPAAIVMVDASLPEPEPAKAEPAAEPAPPEPQPPEPPPPEPAPPEPTPEPPQEKPEPPQQIDEAVVIPAVPPPKPRDRPKPVEQPTPDVKPPPKKPARPQVAEIKPEVRPKPPSAADLIKQIRDRVGDPAPSRSESAGSSGDVDPELAAYQRQLLNCFYTNWIGIQTYRRRRDLQVEFEVRVSPDGGVLSVDKVRPSGEFALDESAERAINRCAPGRRFPPPPQGHNLLHFIFVPGDVI